MAAVSLIPGSKISEDEAGVKYDGVNNLDNKHIVNTGR
jgi:hypothetical protein